MAATVMSVSLRSAPVRSDKLSLSMIIFARLHINLIVRYNGHAIVYCFKIISDKRCTKELDRLIDS